MNIDEAKLTIQSVISETVKLKRAGSGWVGLCPFHVEQTPSFSVTKDRFKCFGCGVSGDVFDFLQKVKGITFLEAKALMNIDGEEAKVRTMHITDDGGPLTAKALQFFSDRGIKPSTLTEFGITESKGSIHFPFFEGTQVVNIKYRDPGKKFRLHVGGKSILYNVNAVDEVTYICEGEIDAMTLSQSGFTSVVSVPNGSNSARNQTMYLKTCSRIFLCGDMDTPGRKMQADLADALGRDRCWQVLWPEGCKDANEVLVKLGQERLRLAVAGATHLGLGKYLTFWDQADNGRPTLIRERLMEFLYKEGGFSLYYYDPSTTIYKLVQNRNGFLRDVTTEHIKKFVISYLRSLPPKFDNNLTPGRIIDLFMTQAERLIGGKNLEFLQHGEFDFLKDTKDEAYFTFRNGIAVVSRPGFELRSYADMNKVVWASQVIEFDIRVTGEVDPDVEYYKFIRAICKESVPHEEYACTLIGYLLHKYKDPTKAFAVVLAEEAENEKEGGGTGKGLFFKAISKMINTVTMDGKSFKQDKSFLFQRVGLDTHLVILEDVKKTVNFELFYPIITEGMTVEKKNQAELFIPYADSAKIGFTTNYSVPATGNHGKRRQKVFEFGNFYSPAFTPENHFKHQMFHDWDPAEWNRFYNFMLLCVQMYLQAGIRETPPSAGIKKKQLKLAYTEEFAEWFFDFIEIDGNYGRPMMQKTLYDDFLREAGFSEKEYSYKRFRSGILTGLEEVGITGMIRKNSQAGGGKELVLTRNIP